MTWSARWAAERTLSHTLHDGLNPLGNEDCPSRTARAHEPVAPRR